MSPKVRATRAASPFVAVPSVVVGVVVGALAGIVAGVAVFAVLALALAAWVRWFGDRRVLTLVGGRDADPRRDARLCNLVEGLSTGAGVRQPRLRIVDTGGLNALAAGIGPSAALLAVTSGLLAELDRIELEAVLAEELVMLRRSATVPATVLVATFGLGRSLAIAGDHDLSADQGAISLTRYPPALAAALEKIEAKGAAVPGQPSYMAHLWLADPSESGKQGRGRLPLADRVEALREL